MHKPLAIVDHYTLLINASHGHQSFHHLVPDGSGYPFKEDENTKANQSNRIQRVPVVGSDNGKFGSKKWVELKEISNGNESKKNL